MEKDTSQLPGLTLQPWPGAGLSSYLLSNARRVLTSFTMRKLIMSADKRVHPKVSDLSKAVTATGSGALAYLIFYVNVIPASFH